MYPEEGQRILGIAFDYLTRNFGILYLFGSVATLLFLLYLAFSRYGDIKLGDTPPDFSTFSWSAMLFCGGIGTSILYWGTVEWAHYYENPPFSVAAGTPQALNWAVSYPIFHWGLIGWALYCLPGVAVSYSYYVRGAKSLRLSEACAPIIGRQANGMLGRIIDLLFVIGLVGACSTGIGLAVPLIGMCVTELFGLDRAAWGFSLDLIVIFVVTVIFATSVWFGLEKGIRRLSDWNVALAFALLLFIAIYGIVLLQEGTRVVPLISSKQLTKTSDSFSTSSIIENNYIPLRFNQAGVMPIILTTAVLVIPNYISNMGLLPFLTLPAFLQSSKILYWISYFTLILLFSSFYSTIVLNPKDISNDLQKMAVSIPGIRPGVETTFYLKKVMQRVTYLGAIMLSILATLPNLIETIIPGSSFNGLGTTSLLILVGVILELSREIRSIILSNIYNDMFD